MSVIVNICPIWNDAQFFNNQGLPLSGGKIMTLDRYGAPKASYVDSSGNAANTNPIILDVNGRLQTSIWLEAGVEHDLVLMDSNDQELRRVDSVITQRIRAGEGISISGNGVGDVTITAPGATIPTPTNGLGQSYEFWLDSLTPMLATGTDFWDFNTECKVPVTLPVNPDITINAGNTEVISFTVSGTYSVVANMEINPDPGNIGEFWPMGVTAYGSSCLNKTNTGVNWLNTSVHTKFSDGGGDGLPANMQPVSFTDYFTISVTAGDAIQFSTYWNNPDNTLRGGKVTGSLIFTRVGEAYNSTQP